MQLSEVRLVISRKRIIPVFKIGTRPFDLLDIPFLESAVILVLRPESLIELRVERLHKLSVAHLLDLVVLKAIVPDFASVSIMFHSNIWSTTLNQLI